MSSVKAQCYIAVPEHLYEKVKAEGYKTTHREYVPCQFVDEQHAADAFTHMHQDTDIVVFAVHDVDASKLEKDPSGTGGKILMKHLPPAHLDDGVTVESFREIRENECPICGETITIEEENELRKKVGLSRYANDGDGSGVYYVGSRCECCLGKWKQRQKRLNESAAREGYHKTSRAIADKILRNGKMIRGSHGNAGGGIYFAETKEETAWKALAGSGASAVILKCKIRMGHVREEFHLSETELRPELKSITVAQMMNFEGNSIDTVKDDNVTKIKKDNPAGPKDSVFLKRGMSGKHKAKSGDEIIVYSLDQVFDIVEV